MSYGDFYDLSLWKECREFRKDVSRIAKQLPPDEKNKLYDQITRSARSVTANISESHGRFHMKESMQMNRIARGSLKETLDHLFVALDEEYIKQAEFDLMKEKYHLCLKLLNGYNKYIQDRGEKS